MALSTHACRARDCAAPQGAQFAAASLLRLGIRKILASAAVHARNRALRASAPLAWTSVEAALRRLYDPPTLAASPLRCPRGGEIRALRRLCGAHLLLASAGDIGRALRGGS